MDGITPAKQEVARENKGDKLEVHQIFDGKPSIARSTSTPESAKNATESKLPTIEFTILTGQKETAFLSDGSISTQYTNQKINPNCKNGVRDAQGNEQRFDRVGLCKVIGPQVKWGKTHDGVMEIALGNKVKLQLDNKWDLQSVSSEHASYIRSAVAADFSSGTQDILAHTDTTTTHSKAAPAVQDQKIISTKAKDHHAVIRDRHVQHKQAQRRNILPPPLELHAGAI